MAAEKVCKHIFETKTENYQELKTQYTTNSVYDYNKLTQERTFLYCRNCGEYKLLLNQAEGLK